MAAREVYKFHHCEKNLLWHYRSGYHFHKLEDIERLVNVVRHVRFGDPLEEGYNNLVFDAPPLAFDWRCPEK